MRHDDSASPVNQFSYHPMRRTKQELPFDTCCKILHHGTSGVLAVIDESGFPYAVPLSYVYAPSIEQSSKGSIFFHSALEGHKISAIQNNPSASFCVIDADEIIPEKFTTAYRSVIAFGQVRILSDKQERYQALELLGEKYNPQDKQAAHKEIESDFERTCVLEFEIDHITGKRGTMFAEKK